MITPHRQQPPYFAVMPLQYQGLLTAANRLRTMVSRDEDPLPRCLQFPGQWRGS